MQHVQHIYLPAGDTAILLLHSFTSNAKEMRHLANVLFDAGYTCYVPNLAGHGANPEKLFASSMEQVWQGAKEAMTQLIDEGYTKIYIVGQSLGGVLGIRLANSFSECSALCILSSPVIERPIDGLERRVAHFAKRYYLNQGKSDDELQVFFKEHFPRPVVKLRALQQFIVTTGNELSQINQPLYLAKGALDDEVFQQSIDLIEQSVKSKTIEKKLYENSGHLITLGKERQQLAKDLIRFFQAL